MDEVTTVVRGFGYDMTHVVTAPRQSLVEATSLGRPFVGIPVPLTAACTRQPRSIQPLVVVMEAGTPVKCDICRKLTGLERQTEESRARVLSSEIPGIGLTEWYPYVVVAGVDTPRTEIHVTDMDLRVLLDGKTPERFEQDFLRPLTRKANRIGYPLFLRTGHGSGKHQYLDTCYVRSAADLAAHVSSLVLWSFTVDIIGLPTDTWVLRELLAVKAPFLAFHGMPVARERRYFIENGKVIGHHPYWPPDAVASGRPTKPDGSDEPDWMRLLDVINDESDEEVALLTELSGRVAAVLPGAWSVDWLDVPDRGWVCIDLAHTQRSFIWHDYPTAPKVEGHVESQQDWWTMGSGEGANDG